LVDLGTFDYVQRCWNGKSVSKVPRPVLANVPKIRTHSLDQAVMGLADEGKVNSVVGPVRGHGEGQALIPTKLNDVGGAGGIGLEFLEEAFRASTAPPKHRLHAKAAAAALVKALVHKAGEIKGAMKSREDLLQAMKASNCSDTPRDLDDMLNILDCELRLITLTDPEGSGERVVAYDQTNSNRARLTTHSYYELTHDYLVPSIREWLARMRKESWRGRAELRLEERTGTVDSSVRKPLLAEPLEYLANVAGVSRRKRTADQRMRAAARRSGSFATLAGRRV
jgi:hypothetical protein